MDLLEQLEKEVDLDQLLERLDFEDEQIVMAALEQPGLFLDASRIRVLKMKTRMRLEGLLEEVQSEKSLRLRRRLERATIPEIKDRVRCDETVKTLTRKLQRAQVEEEFAKLLLEACRMRKDSFRAAAEVMIAEGRAASAHAANHRTLSGVKDRLKKKYPGGY